MEIALLEEKASIHQLVEVDTNKSILLYIQKELDADEYNFIVTTDNLSFAKKQMAGLNKSKKAIDTFRKDKVSSESEDIDLFKSNFKLYLAPIDAKYEQIKKDVSVFESETKDKILKELSLYCEDFIKIQGIRDNFKDVDIIDLMVLGSVTAKGALTKKAREVIESRVMICKSKQDKYDMRLMQLENLSHRAGLESPLTITHIQGIISLDDDSEYETKLNELISSEIERQDIVKANLQKQATENAEREAQQKVINEQDSIRKFFVIDVNHYPLLDHVDAKIAEFILTDYSPFGDYESFARSFIGEQISKLNFHRNDLLKKASDLLADMESKQTPVKKSEVPIVHETIPFTQEEKSEQIKEVTANRKIVKINAIFEVEVPSHVDSGAVLNKVRSRLSECDINSDTLKSLEVI